MDIGRFVSTSLSSDDVPSFLRDVFQSVDFPFSHYHVSVCYSDTYSFTVFLSPVHPESDD